MAAEAQPAKKSYFFGKGYIDVFNTIKGAWKRNYNSILGYRNKIKSAKTQGNSLPKYLFTFIVNNLAILSVLIFGSVITLFVSALNIGILLVVMAAVYICFSVIWLVDRVYLTKNKIFTACNECKHKSLIPTYLCPKCGAKHTNLTPGVYGILERTCTGKDPDSYCGEKLPTTFFNGRRKLEAICPNCGISLNDRESVPICIPVVGGRSVGKTAFITAFSKQFITKVAPEKSWKIEFYNQNKKNIYDEIERDYEMGSTRMTDRPQDINKASSVSFSFFVEGEAFKPERLVHIYDIAGEVFTDNSENEIQKQYEYCHGIVFILDPFSIPSVRFENETLLSRKDIAGIGRADLVGIIDSFFNKLREVTGISDSRMSSVPMAVILSKTDSGDLDIAIGDSAIKAKMKEDPEKFTDYYDTQDYLCREFLRNNGMASFVNSIDLKFKDNRFFACSAIGHTRDSGIYKPQGVLPPMQWLFGKADSKMAQNWNDITFTKKPFRA